MILNAPDLRLVIYINTALYAFNYWLQENTTPLLLKQFGEDPMVYGEIQTLYALIQLVGSPLIGRLGDLVGPRAIMLLSFTAVFLSYNILVVATSAAHLFLARVPHVCKHALQGAQMMITELTSHRTRLAALSRLGVSYAIGMVLGNVAGGVVSQLYGVRVTLLTAASGTLLNFGVALLLVPSPQEQRLAAAAAASADSLVGVQVDPVDEACDAIDEPNASVLSKLVRKSRLFRVLRFPGTRFLLGVKFISFLPVGVIQSIVPLLAATVFSLDPMRIGFLMAYAAVSSMLSQGIFLPFFSHHYSERTLLRLSVATMTLSFLSLAFVETLTQFCCLVLPLEASLTAFNILISTMLTKSVSVRETGAILGLMTSLNSVIAVLAPTMGTWMMSHWGYNSIGWLGFVLNAASYVCLFRLYR